MSCLKNRAGTVTRILCSGLSCLLQVFFICTPSLAQGENPEYVLQIGHTSSVNTVAFSPDGRILASGINDKTIKLWEVVTGRLLQILYGHKDRIYSIAFGPDGRLLGSGSWDRTVKLWEVAWRRPFLDTLTT